MQIKEGIRSFKIFRKSRQDYFDSAIFLSQKTDGPGSPLSKVYTRKQLCGMFSQFSHIETVVRFFRRDRISLLGKYIPAWLDRQLGRLWGWHLYVIAEKQ